VAPKSFLLELPGLNLVWGIAAALLYGFSRFPQSFPFIWRGSTWIMPRSLPSKSLTAAASWSRRGTAPHSHPQKTPQTA